MCCLRCLNMRHKSGLLQSVHVYLVISLVERYRYFSNVLSKVIIKYEDEKLAETSCTDIDHTIDISKPNVTR